MGLIAAVMVAAVLVLAGCGDDSSSLPSSGRTTGTVPRSFACPDPAAKVEPAAGDTLPTGARAARICYSAEMPVEWQPPHEPLTHDVARLVALVNRQQFYPPADGCNADAGPAYRIVLDYPDGARIVSGVTAGCRDVRVGASDREGGRTVWRAYFHLLAQQREHARPGQVPTRPISCPTRRHPVPFTPLAEVGSLGRARLCLSSDDPQGVTMTSRDLRILRHDVRTSAGRRQASSVHPVTCSRSLRFGYEIVGIDRWGDTVDVRAYCRVYPMAVPGTFRTAYVRELPVTAAMFERLVGAARR